jgi:hypothetical protein
MSEQKEQKGIKIKLPIMDRLKDPPKNFGQEQQKIADNAQIYETTTEEQNKEGLKRYREDSIINKCFKINRIYWGNEEIVNALMDIGINPTTTIFRGLNYIENSVRQIMNVMYFEDSEPKGDINLLSDWLEKITDDECPEIPPDFLGFEVDFPKIDITAKKNEGTKFESESESELSDSDDHNDGSHDDSSDDENDDFDYHPNKKKKPAADEEIKLPNLIININDGNAYRPGDPDCHIQFVVPVSNNTLRIQHFICPGGGKELLRDTIKALLQKGYQFNKVELTAADLDPNRFDPNQFDPNQFEPNQFEPKSKIIQDMIAEEYIKKNIESGQFEYTEKYNNMVEDGYIFIDEHGKYKFTPKYRQKKLEKLLINYTKYGFTRIGIDNFTGDINRILPTLMAFNRSTKGKSRVNGGSKKIKRKTKRRQQKKTKKRRKSIKKNNFFEIKRKTKRKRTQRKRK